MALLTETWLENETLMLAAEKAKEEDGYGVQFLLNTDEKAANLPEDFYSVPLGCYKDGRYMLETYEIKANPETLICWLVIATSGKLFEPSKVWFEINVPLNEWEEHPNFYGENQLRFAYFEDCLNFINEHQELF